MKGKGKEGEGERGKRVDEKRRRGGESKDREGGERRRGREYRDSALTSLCVSHQFVNAVIRVPRYPLVPPFREHP